MCGKGKKRAGETADQVAMAQIAAERYSIYKNMLSGVEKDMFANAENMNSGAYQQAVVNRAGAPVQEAVDQQAGALSAGMLRGGVNPASGAYQSRMNDIYREGAVQKAGAFNRGLATASDQGLQAKANIVKYGNNQATSALAGLNEISQASGAEARSNAVKSHNDRSAMSGLIGSIAGAGAGYYMNRPGSVAKSAGGSAGSSAGGAISNNKRIGS